MNSPPENEEKKEDWSKKLTRNSRGSNRKEESSKNKAQRESETKL